MKRMLTRLLLLQKRLFRKGGFAVILLLVPLLAFALRFSAREESGLLTLALSADPADSLGMELAEDLLESDNVLRFVLFPDAESAETAVLEGKADAAWCFPVDFSDRLDSFVSGRSVPVVMVIQREESVFLRLSRELLFLRLVPELEERSAKRFVEAESPLPFNAAALQKAIEANGMGGPLVEFRYLNGESAVESTDYLTAPIRGLLAILIMLCGFAAAIYRAEDRRAGLFLWMTVGERRTAEAAWIMLPMLDTALAVYAALALSGQLEGPVRELLLLLLLVFAGGGFCSALGRIFRRAERIGMAALALTPAMLVLCPIFFNLRRLRALQLLFAPFYYLHAQHAPIYAVWLALFGAIFWLLDILLAKFAAGLPE